MLARHITGLLATSAVLVLCMVLPYLPGRYDALAVTLSTLAQLVGLAGALLVPLGALWLAYELRVRATGAGRRDATDWGHVFALIALGITTLVAIPAAFLAAFEFVPSLGLGLVAIALWTAIAWRLLAGLRARRAAAVRQFNPAPLYLVVVPIAVMAVRLTGLETLADSARQRAIANSAELIADIERHRTEQGRYPVTMLAVHDDYEPQVMGVPRYHYAPRGEAYCLAFEIMSLEVGTREFVLYNPRDEHALPGHDSDLLLWTPEQRAARPGHYGVVDASSPHWKRFLFD